MYRPWVTEPGLWLQYDFGDGPTISGRKTTLFCAWLAWSRFRVVIPIWDKTLPTVAACLDATFRRLGGVPVYRLGGVPVYVLTDNEKTATIDHVAGIAVRNPEIVEVARHYGTTLQTCLPADPESKGGSEATVRIAKADLLPKEVNLREQYHSFGELESACRQFCTDVNTRGPQLYSAAAGRAAGRRVAAAASAAEISVHRGVRHHPAGELGVDDLGGRGAVFGAAHVDRHSGLGPLPW